MRTRFEMVNPEHDPAKYPDEPQTETELEISPNKELTRWQFNYHNCAKSHFGQ